MLLSGSQSPHICLKDKDNIFAEIQLFEMQHLQDAVLFWLDS